ncbi:hypothetical protein AbraIFM66951_006245 [Aspergillus brasiliensis]|uniref:Uncharacterized protein n=1 Tax=Aspergillus brasiliensis TaxID=319629 RepID=A0A9W5Z4V2_9EURO|nr:hypothetical protein AbraCBS73388_005446 [Aspergillus brasiliensis]GKZ51595.1 hypothetical protein AbraIFM66951_006245 [Aspergillus brasiliensis]
MASHGASSDGLEFRKEPCVSNHIRHQFGRVSAYVEELQSSIFNQLLECEVGCQSDTMTAGLKAPPEGKEWLDVPTGPNDMDDNIETKRQCVTYAWNRIRKTPLGQIDV